MGKKLTNVADGASANDAVRRKQLDSIGGGDITQNIDLKNSYNVISNKNKKF